MRAFFATILLATTLPTAAADLAADDSAAGHEQTSGTDAVAATVSAASPGEAEESVGALAAYATAVKLHLERNPVLAAAYISFWNGLTEAEPAAGDTAEVPEERLQGVASTTTRVVRALEERYRQNAAPYRLADTLTIALQAMADGDASSRPESLLATLDRVIAPRVLVNGRGLWAGNSFLAATDSEVYTAYVESGQGGAFMKVIEDAYGEAVTTRTWGTIEKVVKRGLAAAPPRRVP